MEKTKIKDNSIQVCILKDNNSSNWRTINNETLKSIVTKEQFKLVEYIVKENNKVNIFDYSNEEIDKKLDEIFKEDKEKIKQELIECGLEVKEEQ